MLIANRKVKTCSLKNEDLLRLKNVISSYIHVVSGGYSLK